MNKSEHHIIDYAIQSVENGTATEEQKILSELYNAYSLRKSLNNVYEKITPINTREKDIVKIFQNFENSIKSVYDLLYDYCGSSQIYTIDNIIEYTQDVLAEKIRNQYDPQKIKLRRLFKIITCRQYMDEGKWYTLKDIINIIRDHDKDDEIIERQNLRLLIADCVGRGYFIEKDREHARGVTGTLYFMKTDKEFLE